MSHGVNTSSNGNDFRTNAQKVNKITRGSGTSVKPKCPPGTRLNRNGQCEIITKKGK